MWLHLVLRTSWFWTVLSIDTVTTNNNDLGWYMYSVDPWCWTLYGHQPPGYVAVGCYLLPLADFHVHHWRSLADLSKKPSADQQILYIPHSILCRPDACPQSRETQLMLCILGAIEIRFNWWMSDLKCCMWIPLVGAGYPTGVGSEEKKVEDTTWYACVISLTFGLSVGTMQLQSTTELSVSRSHLSWNLPKHLGQCYWSCLLGHHKVVW